jgi:hypothetical protein
VIGRRGLVLVEYLRERAGDVVSEHVSQQVIVE